MTRLFVASGKACPGAAPTPVARARHQSRPHRIEFQEFHRQSLPAGSPRRSARLGGLRRRGSAQSPSPAAQGGRARFQTPPAVSSRRSARLGGLRRRELATQSPSPPGRRRPRAERIGAVSSHQLEFQQCQVGQFGIFLPRAGLAALLSRVVRGQKGEKVVAQQFGRGRFCQGQTLTANWNPCVAPLLS